MKYLLTALVWFCLASTSNVLAQSKTDEEAVGKLPQEFCDAWAKHDGHALAKIMAEDVDFVTVATTYLHGAHCGATGRLLGATATQLGRFQPSHPLECADLPPASLHVGDRARLSAAPWNPVYDLRKR